MATENNTESKKDVKTINDDMPARRVFANVAGVAEYLTAAASTYSDWGSDSIPFAAPGIDAEGNFDPAVYTDDMDIMVAKLSKAKEGTKAIVVAPIPKIDVILADEGGRAWVTKILHKELNHVAVRALREAEDVTTVIDQIPTTLAGYIESGRAGAGIMETFNELYKSINSTLASKLPVWAKYRLIKTELRRAMESKGYASELYAPLEDYRAKGIESGLFVLAIQMGIQAAKRKGMDPAIFERWLATRDQKVYDAQQVEDEDDAFDIDALTDSLLASDDETADGEPTSEDTPAAEGETASE